MKPVLAAAMLILVTAFAGSATAERSHGLELSSAAKTKQTKAKPRPPAQAVRARQPALSGWRPADPSFDAQGRPYRPPPGLSCPIDLGYGRWASCNDEF
jgi:hypothetical protein